MASGKYSFAPPPTPPAATQPAEAPPTSVPTLKFESNTTRTALFPLSATYRVPPYTARPMGELKRAAARPGPSASPARPTPPAMRAEDPLGAMARSTWFAVSATKRRGEAGPPQATPEGEEKKPPVPLPRASA